LQPAHRRARIAVRHNRPRAIGRAASAVRSALAHSCGERRLDARFDPSVIRPAHT
jgi:hypothetical protein